MVELRAITRENWEKVVALEVFDHQKAFVSPAAVSLAQAYVYRETAFPFAVYAEETVVGLIMLGYYESREQYTLWKFLIDKRYQGRGYGKAALQLGLQFLAERFGSAEVYTGVTPGNERARELYAAVGFRATGVVENNMEEMKYIG